ncbi:hypothetical protein KD33_07780 [Clostridium sp. NCR]|nr:hypothetical protein KD33_07780 [Clostridium sp. NCR]
MNKEIMDLIKSLNIPCYYQELNVNNTNKPANYVLFSIYLEKDVEVADNISQATTYYIAINYWYEKSCKDLDKYRQIKNLMKSNGFKFDGINDMKSETHFCKNIDFIKKVWN